MINRYACDYHDKTSYFYDIFFCITCTRIRNMHSANANSSNFLHIILKKTIFPHILTFIENHFLPNFMIITIETPMSPTIINMKIISAISKEFNLLLFELILKSILMLVCGSVTTNDSILS